MANSPLLRLRYLYLHFRMTKDYKYLSSPLPTMENYPLYCLHKPNFNQNSLCHLITAFPWWMSFIQVQIHNHCTTFSQSQAEGEVLLVIVPLLQLLCYRQHLWPHAEGQKMLCILLSLSLACRAYESIHLSVTPFFRLDFSNIILFDILWNG